MQFVESLDIEEEINMAFFKPNKWTIVDSQLITDSDEVHSIWK